MTIYLYIKIHNTTGLKYLGKTSRADPFSYLGSGVYWRRHLQKYGNDFSTIILKECSSNEEVKKWGTFYSNLWDIKNSPEWANLVTEEGAGGATYGFLGKKHSLESIEKIKKNTKGLAKLEETKQKMSNNHVGHSGKSHSDETKQLISSIHKDKKLTTEHKQKIAAALKGKSKSLDHCEKLKKNAKKLKKEIVTPDGVFSSRAEAAIFYKVSPEAIGSRLKRHPKKYYYKLNIEQGTNHD